ncbi:hypothetical protein GCM10023160_06080 [Brachybacterium paraconglomeratum]|uniref:hypothetical protein n=1 Tax=Brachybacterium paraconglomeratum TaxID=173362 RepID=UPI0031ED0FD7
MFTSRPLRTTAAVAALILSLAACGASQDESPTASSDGGGAEATAPAQESQPEPSDGGAEDTGAEGTDTESDPAGQESEESADTSEDSDSPAAGQEAGTLTITLDGEETTFTPEIVRCNGEPGTIRNAIITMKDDELPLVKVTPGEFAMVKLDDRGEPEKSSSLEGISAEDGQISFDNATIGGATVDGTVQCLQGDDD